MLAQVHQGACHELVVDVWKRSMEIDSDHAEAFRAQVESLMKGRKCPQCGIPVTCQVYYMPSNGFGSRFMVCIKSCKNGWAYKTSQSLEESWSAERMAEAL